MQTRTPFSAGAWKAKYEVTRHQCLAVCEPARHDVTTETTNAVTCMFNCFRLSAIF